MKNMNPSIKRYERRSYNIGTRITKVQVAFRIGYLDPKTNILFRDVKLSKDAWLFLSNLIKKKLNISLKEAGIYLNKIYKYKLKQTVNYAENLSLLTSQTMKDGKLS